MFKLVVTPSAKRSLKKLPRSVREDLLKSAQILVDNPLSGEKLTGALNFLYSFHFKSGGVEYRLAYTIDEKQKLIIIHFSHTRENFYDKIRRLFR